MCPNSNGPHIYGSDMQLGKGKVNPGILATSLEVTLNLMFHNTERHL